MTQAKFAKEMDKLETKLNKVCNHYETLTNNLIDIDPFIEMNFKIAVCAINDEMDELQRIYIYTI